MSETLKWLLILDVNANLFNTERSYQSSCSRSLLLCVNENLAVVREKAKVTEHPEHTHWGPRWTEVSHPVRRWNLRCHQSTSEEFPGRCVSTGHTVVPALCVVPFHINSLLIHSITTLRGKDMLSISQSK